MLQDPWRSGFHSGARMYSLHLLNPFTNNSYIRAHLVTAHFSPADWHCVLWYRLLWGSGLGYTRDWLSAGSSVLRAKPMVLTGERTLSVTSGARQLCPRVRQTAADNYVYRLSGVLKNRLERAHRGTDSNANLRHSPGVPAAEKHKQLPGNPFRGAMQRKTNTLNSHLLTSSPYAPSVSTRDTELSSWHLRAARWYHCTTVNYLDSSVRGYYDITVVPCGVSPCPCS
jgi:hypothetical protein